MRRAKFILPLLLLAAACETPRVLGPSAEAGAPSSSMAVDTTPSARPAPKAEDGSGSGILIGSGT
jgi:hypothetical protein